METILSSKKFQIKKEYNVANCKGKWLLYCRHGDNDFPALELLSRILQLANITSINIYLLFLDPTRISGLK